MSEEGTPTAEVRLATGRVLAFIRSIRYHPAAMETQTGKPKRRGLLGRMVFGGKWYWMLLRLVVAVGIIVAFRYRVLTWAAVGHNAAWKAMTGAEENHASDISLLKHLRRPGADALVQLGEVEALASIRDPAMGQTLADMAATHPDPAVRRASLRGAAECSEEHAGDAAARALDDADAAIRTLAAQVLGDKGHARHLPVLRAARDRETDPDARSAMDLAVETLTHVPPAPDAPTPPEHIHKH